MVNIYCRIELAPLRREDLHLIVETNIDIEDLRERGFQNSMQNQAYNAPAITTAMLDVDEWEIHPINIFLGKNIGQGHAGNVHKAVVKSAASQKLKGIVSDSLKYQYVFAAVKILKGL